MEKSCSRGILGLDAKGPDPGTALLLRQRGRMYTSAVSVPITYRQCDLDVISLSVP